MPVVVRIALLSDDRLFSDGILRIIDAERSFACVGHHETADLPPALLATTPDVLLVDSRMAGALGLCAAIRHEGGPPVVLLAVRDDDDSAVGALEAGARGILAKSARAEDLLKAVRAVYDGQVWARRHLMAEWMEHAAGVGAVRRTREAIFEQRLSSREMEISRLAAAGLSNKELAERLTISQATVKAHLTRIFQKLGVRGRTELAAAYHGLIVPGADSTPRRETRCSA
jgi:DNA-binding NarL/FixJ family response regulator